MEFNYSFINYKGGILCVFLAIGVGIIIGLGIGLLIGEHYILSPSNNASLSTDEIEFPTWTKLPTSKIGIYTKAAVATDTKLCGKVGKEILKKKGTAVDVAIAVLVCNGAIHAHSLGIGGGFAMTIFIKSEARSYFLNAREMAPLVSNKTMFTNKPKASTEGPLSVAVPGEIKGYYEAKNRFGNNDISMLELFEPTIKLCIEGFKITRSLEKAIELFVKENCYGNECVNENSKFDSILRKEYTNPMTGKYYRKDEIITRPEFAETLRKIGQSGSSDIFYKGEIGSSIVEELSKQGGIITMEDLKKYSVVWEEPLRFSLNNNLTLICPTPPTSGAITGGIIKIMNEFNIESEKKTMHRFIEAMKFAYAKRSKLGDWNDPKIQKSVNDTIEYIKSDEWMQFVRNNLKDDTTNSSADYYGAIYQYTPDDTGTSSIAVLSENGDAVSVTSTLNFQFGSGIMLPSSHIILNDQMDDFSIPNTYNAYGIAPSQENFIEPQKRPQSSMSPIIITDNIGNVRLVIGASGGPRIISSIAYATFRHLYMNDDIKTAIDAPRPHHQLLPMKVYQEFGIKKEIVDFLKSKGHLVDIVDVYSIDKRITKFGGARVQGIAIDENGIITANNDRRKVGEVDGF